MWQAVCLKFIMFGPGAMLGRLFGHSKQDRKTCQFKIFVPNKNDLFEPKAFSLVDFSNEKTYSPIFILRRIGLKSVLSI